MSDIKKSANMPLIKIIQKLIIFTKPNKRNFLVPFFFNRGMIVCLQLSFSFSAEINTFIKIYQRNSIHIILKILSELLRKLIRM